MKLNAIKAAYRMFLFCKGRHRAEFMEPAPRGGLWPVYWELRVADRGVFAYYTLECP